jgi:transcriptional regulator with XRE-family HTH domain
MLNEDVAFGAQIRALRRARDLSLQQLSDRAGISTGLLSQVERGLSSPSVRTLRQLAEALGVSVGWLFHHGDPPPSEERGVLLRRQHRRRMAFGDGSVVKELLSPDLTGPLEMLIVTVAPGGTSGEESYTHAGDEGGVVISGRIDLWVEERLFRLLEGDSFAFASTRPHRFANPGEVPAQVFWVITPPAF